MSYTKYEVRAYDNGTKEWYQNGLLHRTDGPAIEHANGDKAWYQNGKLHRINGPAFECVDGYKAWYQNGDRHRIDGPAIENANGDKSWYLEGQELTEAEFNAKSKPSCSGKVVEIDGKKYKLTEVS